MTRKIRGLLLPWVIAGVVSAAIVGTAAKNVISDAAENHQITVIHTEDGVPELQVIPELAVIEDNDADEHYNDAP